MSIIVDKVNSHLEKIVLKLIWQECIPHLKSYRSRTDTEQVSTKQNVQYHGTQFEIWNMKRVAVLFFRYWYIVLSKTDSITFTGICVYENSVKVSVTLPET